MTFLAVSGLAGDMLNELSVLGWFLPFLFLFVPVSIALLVVTAKPLIALLVAAQFAGIFLALRAVGFHLRHNRFGETEVRLILCPVYLILCLMTNLVITLGVLFFANFA